MISRFMKAGALALLILSPAATICSISAMAAPGASGAAIIAKQVNETVEHVQWDRRDGRRWHRHEGRRWERRMNRGHHYGWDRGRHNPHRRDWR